MIVKMPVDRVRYLTAEINARLLEIEELKTSTHPLRFQQIKDLEEEIEAIQDEIDDLDEAIRAGKEIVK